MRKNYGRGGTDIKSIVLTVALLFLSTIANTALANDLRIESFTTSVLKNVTGVALGSQLGYLSGNDLLTADFVLITSWDCEPFFGNCAADTPASYIARVSVIASKTGFSSDSCVLGAVTVSAPEIMCYHYEF